MKKSKPSSKLFSTPMMGIPLFVVLIPLLMLIYVVLTSIFSDRARGAEPKPDPRELPRLAPTGPEKALDAFQIKPGFRIELVASEPLVCDPVAMAFDARGRLFVVEMRGYSERREENLGRVRMLTDSDGDGRFDQSTVFAKDLAWPTGVTCWNGGIFVAASPDILYFKDTDEDGIADLRETWFTGFAEGRGRLNVQALVNGLSWGPDNRIHGTPAMNGGLVKTVGGEKKAAAPLKLNGLDFSFDPRTRALAAEVGGGQYGLTFDDVGRKYVCSNSNHIQAILVPHRYYGRNPGYRMPGSRVGIAADGPAAEVFRLSPDEPWRKVRTRWRVAGQVRGPVEGGGRVSGYFTAATGISIYRGNAFPDDFSNNAFVCDAGSNLVHRKLIKQREGRIQPSAERPTDERRIEFLASSDNWFRPVQLANGPDGALYIADMYREVIEHPWSIPESIKKHLDLNSGNDRGRIYRVVPEGFVQAKFAPLDAMTAEQLVSQLDHPNGWHRDTAARLLFERSDPARIAPLKRLVKDGKTALGRMTALRVLDGQVATEESILIAALQDASPLVRRQALVAMERFAQPGPDLLRAAAELAIDSDDGVRHQLALSMSFWTGDKASFSEITKLKTETLGALMKSSVGSPWIRAAVLNAMNRSPSVLLVSMLADAGTSKTADRHALFASLASLVSTTGSAQEKQTVLESALGNSDVALKFTLLKAMGASEALETHKLLPSVMQLARDATAGEHVRVAAVRVLSLSKSPDVPAVLSDLLRPGQSIAIQTATLETLDEMRGEYVGKTLSMAWPSLSPSLQVRAVQALFARQERLVFLVSALREKTLPLSALNPTQAASLRNHKDASIKKSAIAILGAAEKRQPARDEALKRFLPALKLEGDLAEGRTVFEKRCAICHQARGADGKIMGNAVGPDVASFSGAGAATILGNLIDPNQEFQPVHTAYLVETRDGTTWHGSIAEEDAGTVTLLQVLGTRKVIERKNIQSMKSLGISLMPEGLEAGLGLADMADLLAFLSGKKS